MRPAFSVIFLTTLIGAGQGLFLALVAGQFYWAIGATETPETGGFYAIGAGVALVLLGFGLLASFFHLAHPERAWRAATRWRTSWLSREVIVLPLVMGLVALYGLLHALSWTPVLLTFANMKALDLSMAVGYLGAGAALLLFLCTGMIYASIKFIEEWASPLTVANFTLMGAASGFVLAAAYAALMGSALVEYWSGWALTLTVAALAGRIASLWRNRTLRHMSSLSSAVGLHHRGLSQISQGFTAGSFNTHEFFHPGGPEVVRMLTWGFLAAGFVLPTVLITLGWLGGSPILLWAAFVLQYAGLAMERWVFFAEARHPQNLYYQKVA